MSTQPALVDADTVRDHWWWRPGWRIGQRGYTWHLTFAGEPELHRVAREYQAALAPLPQVDPVPIEWLHLTMQNVGFTSDVPPDGLTEILDAVRPRLTALPPATLTFGRPIVLPEAVALEPEPAAPVHALRGAIRAGMADCWGTDNVPDPDQGFRAHLSVGYINRSGPAEPIVQAVHAVETEPAAITVNRASLIELHRDHRIYQWRVVEEVPLGVAR